MNHTPLPILFDELKLNQLDNQTQALIWQIDQLLPQTQCGLCGYRDGCLPYAHAIATNDEAINLCVPGGDETSHAIAKLTNKAPKPAMPSKWATHPTTNRPISVRAIIDETACIGCTKCIPACPVDAIIGTAKHMHSIVANLCTGCELCLPPCPVDCIRLEPITDDNSPKDRLAIQNDLRNRYHAHLNRTALRLSTNDDTPVISHTQSKLTNTLINKSPQETTAIDKNAAQHTIKLASLRTQIKKLEKQLSLRADPSKTQKLKALQDELNQLQNL